MTTTRLPFLDLHPAEDGPAIRAAMARVLESGWFVLGPEVEAFEQEFARASGAAHAIGVGNGTDAIAVILRALGIGAGDEVVVPAISAAYTALAVTMLGARPVFADVDAGTLTMDPASCAARVSPRTRAIVPVHLYGQPADLDAIGDVASRHGLAVVEDCCQAHLATCRGTPVGTIGVAGAFSFYPTKNLGALGDAGAIVTNDSGLAARLRQLRNGGQAGRYEHVTPGVNSRLDELQAAVLRARLPLLPRWTDRRRALARAYRAGLAGSRVVPVAERDPGHVYHLFPVRSVERDRLRARLHDDGIETLIHYPATLPAQPAFAACTPDDCPVATAAVEQILSLPLHPRLTDQDVRRVCDAVTAAQGES